MNKSLSTVLLPVQSFLATWAMMRISGLHAMDVIAFLFFFLCLIFFTAVKKEGGSLSFYGWRRKQLLSLLSGFAFTCFYLADIYGEIVADLDNLLFKWIIWTVTFAGLYLLFSRAVFYLICLFERFTPKENKKKHKIMPYLPLICFLSCVLCRIPFLLYSYPGIMTPDSINQFEQVIGMKAFSNHHPWVHTLTISLFYHLGTLFTSSINDAFLFYTLFQICFMALAAGYLVWVVGKYAHSLLLSLSIIAFYALMPYNNVMAICIWKDVLFAGTLLFFCTSLFHLIKEEGNALPLPSVVIYSISGCLMCLYRSNGWYAFLLTLPLLLICFWKQKKYLYPLHFFMLFLVLIIKGPVMDHFQVVQPDFVESISIPLQQVCRVVAQGKELTPEQEALLNRVMNVSYIDDLYAEHISDNMKELVRAGNPEYLTRHKGEFFRLWLELGCQYPKIYLDAYIEQTRGYYSPSAVYPVADVEGVIANDTGLSGEYLIGGKALVKIREILLKLHTIIPLYGAFWSMGSLLWLALLTLVITLSIAKQEETPKKKKKGTSFQEAVRLCAPWLPGIAIIATLLIATPVATEFRYAYHLVYCIPLYPAIMLITQKEAKKSPKKEFGV